MGRLRTTLAMMGILAASTVGAGIFTLPWVFRGIGWGWAIVLLAALGALVGFAQYSYWRTLDAVRERGRLVGLARAYLGKEWGVLTLLAVVGGMLFTLVVYLALAERFIGILLPLHGRLGLILFWLAAVAPATLNIRRFAALETFGTLLKAIIILFVLTSAAAPTALFRTAPFQGANPLLFIGAILFAMGGWSAIEPMYELWKGSKTRGGQAPSPLSAISGGIFFIGALYVLFVAGIAGSLAGGSTISPDTLSGLTGWPAVKLGLLAIFGLLGLWTPYAPTLREAEHALHNDLGWNGTAAFLLMAAVPLVAVLGGFTNILGAVALAGAVFGGIQYVSILMVSRKVLQPRVLVDRTMLVAAAIFAAAALYEAYLVVVH